MDWMYIKFYGWVGIGLIDIFLNMAFDNCCFSSYIWDLSMMCWFYIMVLS